MDKELDDLLVKTFPNLYKDRYGDPSNTNMVWGFPGRGWFLILWNLSEKLEKLILDTPEDQREGMQAAQCKEKFGQLRVYINLYNEEMQAEINKAEKLSLEICENCGAPGCLRTGGWIKTLCDFCLKIGDKFSNGENR